MSNAVHSIFTDQLPDPINQAAQFYFNIPYVYPWQRLVIANIQDILYCHEKNIQIPRTEEVFAKQIVLLPTGAGKSLCFLLPAILCSRPTLIIYPLLALMSDQQRRLEQQGIAYALFRGGQSHTEREAQLQAIRDGARIIIANPEILASASLRRQLTEFNIIHAVIDEAHCVTQWGDTFRPSYLKLPEIITDLAIPVVSAFTATASVPVLNRIKQILFNGEAHLIQGDTDRPNIKYHVVYAYSKMKTVLELTEQYDKPQIIFCSTRYRSEQMAHLAAALYGKDKIRFYHAGLEKKEKREAEQWFLPSTDTILCCTCAFGLGVDKANIRTVIHLDVPPTVEAYIQEAGRGGRDGGITNAIMVWSSQDKKRFENASDRRQQILAEYASGSQCRRQVLLKALNGIETICSGCDVCAGTARQTSFDAERILSFIHKHQGQFTFTQAARKIMFYLNRVRQKNGLIPIWNEPDIKEVLLRLCMEHHITKRKLFYEHNNRLYAKEPSSLPSCIETSD